MTRKTKYVSPEVGQHVITTFVRVPREYLVDHELLMDTILKALEAHRYGILSVDVRYFTKNNKPNGRGGYTATLTLSESHLTLHTYVEHATIAFDFYTCRGPEAAWPVFEEVVSSRKLEHEGLVSLQRRVCYR